MLFLKRQHIYLVTILCIISLSSGCVVNKTFKVKPTVDHYVFLKDIKPIGNHYRQLYQVNSTELPRLAARLTEPHGYTIKFHGNPEVVIGEPASKETGEPRTFLFREGVYPFSLYRDKKDDNWYSGLLVVYDIDETLELATFGESEETRLFNLDIFRQARQGVMGQFSITFDNKEVMRYWLGDRDSLYPGGQPTVEVDFSHTPRLTDLTINGKEIEDKKQVLKLNKYYLCSLCDEKRQEADDFGKDCEESNSGRHKPYLTVTHKNYPIEMATTDGKRYQGYIRNLVTNVFTAFMSIPCEIPPELFDNAARGTISKLTVQSPGEEKQKVAEIVFGLAK